MKPGRRSRSSRSRSRSQSRSKRYDADADGGASLATPSPNPAAEGGAKAEEPPLEDGGVMWQAPGGMLPPSEMQLIALACATLVAHSARVQSSDILL